MLFKRDELQLLWPFYASSFFFGLTAVIMPFLIIYFRNLGFTFFQIGMLTAAFSIGMILFEIPTGAFADGWSRKWSVILGLLITGIPALLMSFFSNLWILILLWGCAGIGMSFVSGAEEAWIVDNLNHHHREDLHHEYFLKSQSIAGFGLIFAPLLGTLLVQHYPLTLLWYIFAGGFLIGALLLLCMPEEYVPEKTFKQALQNTWRKTSEGVRFTLMHKAVLFLILGSMFVVIMGSGENGWQPFLVSTGLPTPSLGWVYALMGVAIMTLPLLTRLFMHLRQKFMLSAVVLLRMMLLFALLFVYSPYYLFAVVVFIMDRSLFALNDPLTQTILHRQLPKNVRATVVSVKSMVLNALALLGIVAGMLMDVVGIQYVLALSGLFGIAAIAFYWRVEEHTKHAS